MIARIYTADEAAALLAAAETGPYAVYGEDGIIWPARKTAFDPIGAVSSRLDEAQGAANGALLAASWDLAASVVHHAERADRAEAEIERLRAELAMPVAGRWRRQHDPDWFARCTIEPFHRYQYAMEVGPRGWHVRSPDLGGEGAGDRCASGPETGEAGRRLADEAATAVGWRLL